MLTFRRKSLPYYANSNSITEASSPEPASHTQAEPDEIPLPPSRSSSPDIQDAGDPRTAPVTIPLQEEPNPGEDREQPTEAQVGHQNEAVDNEEIPGSIPDTKPYEGPDPFAHGEKKLAEFWPMYVKEADSFDKELSEGWNNMLEVILIFAALFSAISTAFVLESSKDLKPDPAESSAATLLLISQTLLAMSNPSGIAPAAVALEPAPFVPARSAVAVNVLWFTSLILSVSVTLVAMLAKEWTHLFMVGRTGMPMEQARKRQKRYDGLKAWKMEGVITALPTLMHLALFLFAGGLCVYLWNIHIGVAVPVVLLTSITVLIYVAALVLPLIYDYCPYVTALSKLVKPYPGTWSRKRDRQPDSNVSGDKVQMDATTSRTLAWMISNSEVPQSVDHAIQAIAGTSFGMPNEALWECNVPERAYSYLKGQLKIPESITAEGLKRLELSDSRKFTEVLACAQTLNLVAVERREHAIASPGNRPRNATSRLWDYEGFYSSLYRPESLHMKAVGYAASAICAQNGMPFYYDKSNHLLDVSGLAVLALRQQSPQQPTLCHMTFTALSSEATDWDPSRPELATQRPKILKNMLATVRFAVEKDLVSSEFARAVCAVGLSINRQNDDVVGKVATHFFASDNQLKYLQNLGDSCAVWGLCGLLFALKSDQLLKSLQESVLEPVFRLLHTYVVEKNTLAGLLGDSVSDSDIAICLTETVLHCYQCLNKRNLEPHALQNLLSYILRQWRGPCVISTVAALLEHPASDYIREDAVHNVAQSKLEVAGMGIAMLSSAFYEAVRLENTDYRVPPDNVSRLTQHFEQFPARHGQDIHMVICALLTQLLDESLFQWLIVVLDRARLQGDLRHWRGIEVGHMVQFWGEHIIQWGHEMLRESKSSNTAQRLQNIFTSKEQLVDVYDLVVQGASELRDLLWQEIEKAEDLSVTSNPPSTPMHRVSGRVCWPWRSQYANDEAV